MASANNQFKSHDDARRARELDEARKAGLAPAAVDEEGKAINPHIPSYMKDAPWYLGSTAPSLKHQKDWREGGSEGPGGLSSSAAAAAKAAAAKALPKRGDKVFQATTFRKGACENCGAMTHKARDCLERPRARKAKLTGKHIAADEAVVLPIGGAGGASGSSSSFAAVAAALTPSSTSAHLVGVSSRRTFDGKHDRWEGYDPTEHDRVVELFEKVEKAKEEAKRVAELERRFRKKEKKEKKEKGEGEGEGSSDSDSDSDSGSSSDDKDDEEEEEKKKKEAAAAAAAAAGGDPNNLDDSNKEKLGDDADAAFSKLEKRVRAPGGGASGSVRNLRIREDTAKYLLNLDPESAYFDPKSRSMRGDPTPHVPREKKAFAGDGAFVRPTGSGSGASAAGATPSDYQAWASLQAHAAHAAAAGNVVDVAAAPSAAEALAREYARRKAALDAATRARVLDKYGDGGASVINLGNPSSSASPSTANPAAPSEEEAKRLLYGASERYVEYSKATGKPILSSAALAAAAAAAAAGGVGSSPLASSSLLLSSMPRSSLYEEDVHPGNHSSVWGSWWNRDTRCWGYSCCHSSTKNAYCLGEAGKKAVAAAREQLEANMRSLEEQKKRQEEGEGSAGGGGKGSGGGSGTAAASSLSQRQKQSLGASIGAGLFSDDAGASALDVGELDAGKLKAALAAEDARKKREREEKEEEEEEKEKKKRKKKEGKRDSGSSDSDSEEEEQGREGDDDDRRRTKFSSSDVHPSSALTAEELEAYRLRRDRADDPMLQARGKGKSGGGGEYDLV